MCHKIFDYRQIEFYSSLKFQVYVKNFNYRYIYRYYRYSYKLQRFSILYKMEQNWTTFSYKTKIIICISVVSYVILLASCSDLLRVFIHASLPAHSHCNKV